MSPDSQETNTVKLPNPVNDFQLAKEDYSHKLREQSLGGSCPLRNSAMNLPSSKSDTKDSTAWIVNPAENTKSDPVALLRYHPHNDSGRYPKQNHRPSEELPIFTPIHTNHNAPVSLSGIAITINDYEKGKEHVTLSEKHLPFDNGHALNGLLPSSNAPSRISLPNTNSSASLVPNDGDPHKEEVYPAENTKSDPVALLRYQPHNDSGRYPKQNHRPSELFPIFNPNYTNHNKPVSRSGIAIPINEKGKENVTLSEKHLPFDNGHVLNGLLPSSNATSRISLPNTNSSASLVPNDGDPHKGEVEGAPESIKAMTIQVFIPFLIAGFGMVGAGLVLDQVQHWEVFREISAIYVVIPPLLGLKGNLEMTLASRLSTLANLGVMDSRKSKITLIGGNMVVSQCLASVIGLLTSVLAVLIGSIQDQKFNLDHSLVLVASSVATAAASSCILDFIMVLVILLSRKYGINPDNVATPIAASLGDITTTALLAGIATALYSVLDKIEWVGPIVACMFLVLVPLWIYLATKQPYTAEALKTTCGPVLGAMFISTGGGFILNIAVKKYVDLAVFQPIINGVGGNLVAIQASRIATSLHQSHSMGVLPESHPTICVTPWSIFTAKGKHVRCARVLISMVIPGHLIFIYMTSYISTGEAVLSLPFVLIYLVAAMLQVAILLYVATIITYLVWRYKIDPDNFSIPLLTALGDLLGIGLLALAFLLLEATGERTLFFPKNAPAITMSNNSSSPAPVF